MLSTITRIGPLLDLFTAERPEHGVTDVAAALNVPRSSAHALLSSLASTGILQSHKGRYRIGWRVLELSELQRATSLLRKAARPVLEKLSRKVSETVNLAVLERDMVLYVDKIVAAEQLITVAGPRIGSRIHANHTAIGKLLLSGVTDRERDRILETGPRRRPSDGVEIDLDQIRAEIARATTAGHAFDLGETAHGLSCVAAPVYRADGSIVAAISISTPEQRFAERRPEYVAAVIAAAQEITTAFALFERDRG